MRWQGGEQSCGNVTSCRIGNLHNGTTYTFTVRARNAIGWSPDSNAVTGRPNRAPEPPGQVQVRGGHRSVEVSWNEPDYAARAQVSHRAIAGARRLDEDEHQGDGARHILRDRQQRDHRLERFSATVVANNEVGASVPSRLVSTRDVWGDPMPAK